MSRRGGEGVPKSKRGTYLRVRVAKSHVVSLRTFGEVTHTRGGYAFSNPNKIKVNAFVKRKTPETPTPFYIDSTQHFVPIFEGC